MKTILVILLILAIVNADVVELHDSNFSQQVSGNGEQLWMVMFGADWCGHCQHLKPEFQKASNEMSNFGIKFGYVNEKGNGNLVGKYVADPVTHMVSYPKVAMILGQEILGQLPGQYRNSHSIKFWFENTFTIKNEEL